MQPIIQPVRQKERLLEDFIERYVTCLHLQETHVMQQILQKYEEIINCFSETACEEEDLLKAFESLAKTKIQSGIPYIAMSNEIFGLKNLLLQNGIESSELRRLLELFYKINNRVARIYLDDYLKRLKHINNIRITSLNDLPALNIVHYFKEHLVWLNELVAYIDAPEENRLPELDESSCIFGRWLDKDAKELLANNSKLETLSTLHKTLHLFAKKIGQILPNKEYHLVISYLEKCELISLNIGTELVLVDNAQINQKVTKDALTGALNRHALKAIFETQYELAMATQSSFILAMCDLDHFKRINDTYGHVAGDEVLKLFVRVVKKNIRNSDVIIRYGGEEFVIMMPAIPLEKAVSIFEKILKD